MFADPFSVSLHAITRHPPPPGGRVARVRRGRARHVRARDPAGAVPRRRGGGRGALRRAGRSWPAGSARPRCSRTNPAWPSIEELAAWWRRPVLQACDGLPMAYPGGIDVVYDTVGKPETFEVGVRVLKARGTLVKAGVHAPGRWEGARCTSRRSRWSARTRSGSRRSTAQRKHAHRALPRPRRRRPGGPRPMLTHTFRLEQWRDAFLAIANQGRAGPSRWRSTFVDVCH